MQMLITQALDERDLLAKKIKSAIDSQIFISWKRKSKDVDFNNAPVDKIKGDIQSTYQSIQDMTKRYYMIIQKIAESNAVTKINVDGQEMTISAAISIIKDIKLGNYFESKLLKKFEADNNQITNIVKRNNDTVETNKQNMLQALLSRNDSKNPTEKETELVNATLDGDYAEFIDPIDIGNKIKDLKSKTSELEAHILSAIKVSNATTVIDID